MKRAEVKEVEAAERSGSAAQKLLAVTCDAFARLTDDLRRRRDSRRRARMSTKQLGVFGVCTKNRVPNWLLKAERTSPGGSAKGSTGLVLQFYPRGCTLLIGAQVRIPQNFHFPLLLASSGAGEGGRGGGGGGGGCQFPGGGVKLFVARFSCIC